MKIKRLIIVILTGLLVLFSIGGLVSNRLRQPQLTERPTNAASIQLPDPDRTGGMPLEQAINDRRSIRSYQETELTLAQVGQLLWSAQGITHPGGLRAAPSAGALYPLELYLVVGQVEGLAEGVYRYRPEHHSLELHLAGDQRQTLCAAALGQECVQKAPAVILMTAVYERTTVKYGSRGEQYVHMEVGGAAQNVYLQATALDLGTVFIGAFHDDQVQQILRLPAGEIPLCIMPVGKP
jgi:SagB-type dehydrogenase family enzyme